MNQIVSLAKSAFLISLLAGASGNAFAGEWFLHKFGELRSYHGHFLNVCAKAGHGLCRSVQYRVPPGSDTFFGDASLSVVGTQAGADVIEVFVRTMPHPAPGPITLMLDSQPVLLRDDQWAEGTVATPNVAETFHISDAAMNARIISLMKSANTLRISYAGGKGGVRFSLRGFTAARRAIRQLLQTR
jgi:hypothetical protein